MVPATRLRCGLLTCTLGVNSEQGGTYMRPPHLSTIEKTQVDMRKHKDIYVIMAGLPVRGDYGARRSEVLKPDRLS